MRKILIVAVLLLASAVLAADPPPLDLYIGFTGVQASGNTRFVNTMIMSNEGQNAVNRMIFTTLTVKTAAGAEVCNTSVEKYMKPMVQPLQFRVTYVGRPGGGLISKGTQKYNLYARFQIEGNPTQVTNSNDQIEYPNVEFPGGGTPSCVNLLP